MVVQETAEFQLGSRLKTPMLPIWVICCKGQWGILFSPSKSLIKSYQAENKLV
jgi:hypothetical protein